MHVFPCTPRYSDQAMLVAQRECSSEQSVKSALK